MSNPSEEHWTTMKRIVRYLNGAINLGLRLQPSTSSNFSVQAYCDADWASDPNDRRSTIKSSDFSRT